jgi:hypothetical protein
MPIPVPIATDHRVEVSAGFELQFTCERCRASATARVHATSAGSAMGLPLSLAARGPVAKAEARAMAGLDDEAKALVLLARCPKCSARGPGALRDWWVVHSVQAVFVVAIFVGFPLVLFGSLWSQATTGGLVALGVVAYLVLRFRVRLGQVDKRVAFDAEA